MNKSLFGVSFLLGSSVTFGAQFCIAPIDQRYHQSGQYGDFEVQVGKNSYRVSHIKPVKVNSFPLNKNFNVTIKKQSKAIESFSLQLAANENVCLVKNDLYPTWMLVEMRKSCQC